MSALRRLRKCLTIAELKNEARRCVPKMFFDYADSGSWTESTYAANESDFHRLYLRQRILRDVSALSLSHELLGKPVGMPLALAPVGMCGMQHADGEIHAARAAEKYGVPFILSTMSVCSIEDVAAAVDKPFWFQLYVMRDRDFMERLVKRAIDAGCSALVLTVDLQILAQRHSDIRNGLSAPPRPNLSSVLQVASRPAWCLRMLGATRWQLGNVVGHATGVSDLGDLTSWTKEQFDPSLSWRDVEYVRSLWPGKLVVKGVMDPEDARLCVQRGVDALVVSNHGGRQLDGARSSISSLRAIVDAVGNDIEVHMDGGVRSGQDVLRALSLGAKGVYVGRPYLYGLGAGGQQGVEHALEIIKKEMSLTMSLCGETNVKDMGLHNLDRVSSDFLD